MGSVSGPERSTVFEPQTERGHETRLHKSRVSALRLLIVTPRFLPLMGGVETHVYQVGQRLAQAGVKVTVLTTDPRGEFPAREETDGIEIRRERAWPANRDYYFAPNLYSTIRHGDWHLVHVQSYHTLVAPLTMLAAWRARIPYVVTFHSGGHSAGWRNAIRGAQRAALAPLLRRADRLIAVAQFERDLFARQLGVPVERIALIPNGSDLPHPVQAPAPAEGATIVSVGRLERYKGHQRVVAAMPAVLRRRPEARLKVLGVGPYEGELRRLTHALGLDGRVEVGSVAPGNRDGMARALSEATLVVSLSEYETHPVAIMEALALRRPVLVADTSGLAELAARGWAAKLPLDSGVETVAEAIVAQLASPHQPEGVSFPTWDECAASLLALYEDTLAGRAACAF